MADDEQTPDEDPPADELFVAASAPQRFTVSKPISLVLPRLMASKYPGMC